MSHTEFSSLPEIYSKQVVQLGLKARKCDSRILTLNHYPGLLIHISTFLFHPTNVALMRKQVFPQFPFDLCLLHQEPIKQLENFTFIKMSSLRVARNLKFKASSEASGDLTGNVYLSQETHYNLPSLRK